MNTHEPKRNKEQPNEFWNPGPRWVGEHMRMKFYACIITLTAPRFDELSMASHFQIISVPWEPRLLFCFFAHFRRTGRAKRLHKGLLLSRLLSLHKKHKHFLQASSLLAVATPLSRRALIRGWCANLSRIPIEPAPSALMGLPQKKTGGGGGAEPTSLIGCQSLSLTQSLTVRPSGST